MKKMKRDTGEKKMKEEEGRCNEEVRKLNRFFTYEKQEADRRTGALWEECKAVKTKQGNVRNMINEAKGKMDRLEKTLGYYCGTENMELSQV